MKLGYRGLLVMVCCTLAPALAIATEPVTADRHDAMVRQQLLDEFQNAHYFFEQFDIAQRIVELHDRSVLPLLVHWLSAEDRHCRGNAAFIFASLGDVRGFDTIVAILNDQSWRPEGQGTMGRVGLYTGPGPAPYNPAAQIKSDRYYAAHLLGDLKDRRAVPILIPLLTDEDVNYIVPWALGEIGDQRAVGPLIRTLTDTNPDMRVLAIYGLEQLDAKDALPALYRLRNDQEKTHFDRLIPVGEAAIRAIAKLEVR